MKKIAIVQTPSKLSHFTTVRGLLGILKTHCLWASNVAFLNDKKELSHGINVAIETLGQFSKIDQGLIAIIKEDLKTDKLPDTYATCFCEDNDVLSQWRGYGREQGVSVTFKTHGLTRMFDGFQGIPMEVIYDRERTKNRFKRILEAQFEELDDLFGNITEAQIRSKIIKRVSKLIPRFKDDGFFEENEWRYVIQRDNDFANVELRENDGVIVPYIEVKQNADLLLPIDSITVGPGKNQELAVKSIEIALRLNDYDNVEVKTSSVPYRT